MKILGLPASTQDEDSARAFLEVKRWPSGPICPHCGSLSVTRLTPKADSIRPARKGVIKCKDCRKQFTVTVGTIFEDSHIPLHKWLLAIHFLCSSKKGMSAHQLHRMLGITYKSAWFMAHRIRKAMEMPPLSEKLKGVVEVDETNICGKTLILNRGRGSGIKFPVGALVERNGNVRSKPIARVSVLELKTAIRENVHPDSTIMTDEWIAYRGIGTEFKGGHKVIKHKSKQYVKGDIYTNTAESYFAILKRGINGTFHHISKKHLGRYCDEFAFRWNHRKTTDDDRALKAIAGAEGKRLFYRMPVEAAKG